MTKNQLKMYKRTKHLQNEILESWHFGIMEMYKSDPFRSPGRKAPETSPYRRKPAVGKIGKGSSPKVE